MNGPNWVLTVVSEVNQYRAAKSRISTKTTVATESQRHGAEPPGERVRARSVCSLSAGFWSTASTGFAAPCLVADVFLFASPFYGIPRNSLRLPDGSILI